METEWYYVENGRKCGPVSIVDLQEAVKIGTITRTTKITKKSLGKWILAEKLHQLFSPVPADLELDANDIESTVAKKSKFQFSEWRNFIVFASLCAAIVLLLWFVIVGVPWLKSIKLPEVKEGPKLPRIFDFATEDAFKVILTVLVFVVVIGLMILPSLVASIRMHHQKGPIMILNLTPILFGTYLFGFASTSLPASMLPVVLGFGILNQFPWLIALAWSVSYIPRQRIRQQL